MIHGSRIAAHSDTITHPEIHAMAQVLLRRYRGKAIDVARHFADEHEAVGDRPRARVWTRVARCIRASDRTPTLS